MAGTQPPGGEIQSQIAARLGRLLAELNFDRAELASLPDESGEIKIAAGRIAVDKTIAAACDLSAKLNGGSSSGEIE